jgi:hypothetical protein
VPENILYVPHAPKPATSKGFIILGDNAILNPGALKFPIGWESHKILGLGKWALPHGIY